MNDKFCKEKNIKNKIIRLSEKDFLSSFKKVPRIAINILIFNDRNQILLLKRNIPPYIDFWHLPGSFLLKNEAIDDALMRIAKDELGLKLTKEAKLNLLGAFDDIEFDPRGHVVDLIYSLNITNTIKIILNGTPEVNFFDKNRLPDKIGFNHREILSCLKHKMLN